MTSFGSILNPNDPNLRAFEARGGKLIQYHGWSDASIPPEFSVNYFDSVQETMGNTQKFFRLFMAPGVAHCGGGIGAIAFTNAPHQSKMTLRTICSSRSTNGSCKALPPIKSLPLALFMANQPMVWRLHVRYACIPKRHITKAPATQIVQKTLPARLLRRKARGSGV